MKLKIVYYILFLLLPAIGLAVDQPKPQVGIEEKLGQYIPQDITVIDEYGKPIKLFEIAGKKPFVLTMVYYRCPGICTPLLNGLTKVVDKSDLIPGKDYMLITVSFDPREDYSVASEKKKNYFSQLKNKKLDNQDWRFCTADSATVARLTDAIGFRYIQEGNDFVHSAVLNVVSPDGKISRYLYGTEFLPLDFKLALIEASEGKTGTTISKVVSLCYSYDPEGKRYVLDITRIAGGGILLLLAVFVMILVIKKKKK